MSLLSIFSSSNNSVIYDYDEKKNSFVYNVNFAGEKIQTTVTNEASVADQWVTNIRSIYGKKRVILGLDCKLRVAGLWGMFKKVATLQLCVDNLCLILQMVYMDDFPESLKNFLNDPHVTCVGLDLDDYASKLRSEFGLKCCSLSDIQELASNKWEFLALCGPKLGIKDLAWHVLGIDMEKPKQISKNWQATDLDSEQIKYACADAYACFRIGRKLLLGT